MFMWRKFTSINTELTQQFEILLHSYIHITRRFIGRKWSFLKASEDWSERIQKLLYLYKTTFFFQFLMLLGGDDSMQLVAGVLYECLFLFCIDHNHM